MPRFIPAGPIAFRGNTAGIPAVEASAMALIFSAMAFAGKEKRHYIFYSAFISRIL